VLWHNAYPDKDFGLIKSTLPELTTSVNELADAPFPEMLHNRKAKWDEEIKGLQNNLGTLQKAVADYNKESMLSSVESVHSSFEKLVRVIRPKLQELDSFHEDLYQLYHKYMPASDLAGIKAILPSMKEKSSRLKEAKLNKNFASKQGEFTESVNQLQLALAELESTVESNNKKKAKAAVEKVHGAYQRIDVLLE
jgi:uncharacterized protein YukE